MNKKGVRKKARKYLEEFVYGATDGSITTFAVVAGAIGASLSPAVILILGFANLFADGFSMATSAYLSSKSHKELFKKEKYSNHKKPIQTATATFFSFILIGIIPLIVFVIAIFKPMPENLKFIYTIILTAIALSVVGFIKGIVIRKNKIRSSLETLLIGSVAASIAYLVGYLLRGLA